MEEKKRSLGEEIFMKIEMMNEEQREKAFAYLKKVLEVMELEREIADG